jgi:hypothetical protein
MRWVKVVYGKEFNLSLVNSVRRAVRHYPLQGVNQLPTGLCRPLPTSRRQGQLVIILLSLS